MLLTDMALMAGLGMYATHRHGLDGGAGDVHGSQLLFALSQCLSTTVEILSPGARRRVVVLRLGTHTSNTIECTDVVAAFYH